ncbi:HIG1 domain-containing protein [Roseococcus pinisoli]|uniref:HIG1 domain-containing protein n=1 Tax=Roseococcus pinisoli TaxID=2835040 RepID=A0ABS5Q9X3_9PROT|nr:HIG1 domain-containing protein [Roseococcus pinisoli]MBS7810460.1 HIG1 domain-containing protein [Roseococcus pinisoli]
MKSFFTFLVMASMAATLGVLIAGMIGMARGVSGQASQKLMRYRVLLQGLSLVLFAILMMLWK